MLFTVNNNEQIYQFSPLEVGKFHNFIAQKQSLKGMHQFSLYFLGRYNYDATLTIQEQKWFQSLDGFDQHA